MTKEEGKKRPTVASTFDLKRLLDTRPQLNEKNLDISGEEDEGLLPRDFDPEQVDFGGSLDRTSAKKTISSIEDVNFKDESRSHYLNGLPGRSKKSRIALPIDDVDFMDGKYAGAKATRASLGFVTSTNGGGNSKLEDDLKEKFPKSKDFEKNFEENFEFISGTESFKDKKNGTGKEEDHLVREQLMALREAENAQLEMVARKAVDDVERGRNVREQVYKWQNSLNVRIRLQPLLSMAQSLPGPNYLKALASESTVKEVQKETEEELGSILNELLKYCKSFCSGNLEGLSGGEEEEAALARFDRTQSKIWRESLDKWNQKVALTTGDKLSAKRQLKVINQSLWTQVENAMKDRSRLISRALTRRTGSVPIVGPVESAPVFDDGDFFPTLLRSWVEEEIGEKNVALTAGLIVKSVKNNQGRTNQHTSKGRKLRYDIQDRLVNYMVPVKDPYQWPEEKIATFFNSIFPDQ